MARMTLQRRRAKQMTAALWPLPSSPLAVVLGLTVRKGCKSGQEHGVLQSVVTTCSRTGLSPGRGNRPVSLHRCTMTRSASRRVAVCVQAVARALMGPLERNRQTCSKDDENHERPVPRNSPTPPVKPP